MRKLAVLAGLVVVFAPVAAVAMLWRMVQELEHVADNLGDTDEWWNDTFNGYEWDDDWDAL